MKKVSDVHQEHVHITPEGAERRVLSYGGKLMAVQFVFESGVETPPHSHPHEQIGYVVSGVLDLYMDGQDPQRLGAGGSYYIPPEVTHSIITREPTVLVDCFTPLREDFLGGPDGSRSDTPEQP